MAAASKTAVVEYYWSPVTQRAGRSGVSVPVDHVVNVRFIAANGTQVGQSTQGSRDKRDARRAANGLAVMFAPEAPGRPDEYLQELLFAKRLKERGPGPKPKIEPARPSNFPQA